MIGWLLAKCYHNYYEPVDKKHTSNCSVQKELPQVLDNIKLLETQIGVGTAKAKRFARQNLEKLVAKRDENLGETKAE